MITPSALAVYAIVPMPDPAPRRFPRPHPQDTVPLVTAGIVAAMALVAAVLAGVGAFDPAPSGAVWDPAPVAVCDTDRACAAHDTWLAQQGYGVPVWADTPHVTPHVDEARMGGVRLSCDPGRAMVDTDDGAACVLDPASV